MAASEAKEFLVCPDAVLVAFASDSIADIPIGGANIMGEFELREACGFGNPRYGRLGGLRYNN